MSSKNLSTKISWYVTIQINKQISIEVEISPIVYINVCVNLDGSVPIKTNFSAFSFEMISLLISKLFVNAFQGLQF